MVSALVRREGVVPPHSIHRAYRRWRIVLVSVHHCLCVNHADSPFGADDFDPHHTSEVSLFISNIYSDIDELCDLGN